MPEARSCACCRAILKSRSGPSPPTAMPGQRLGGLQPHLHALADRVLPRPPWRSSPGTTWCSWRCRTAPARRSRPQLPTDTLVVDAGADHRLEDPWPGRSSTGRRTPGSWPYGLPELPGPARAARGATRIAVPGCYPTSSLLALAPGFAAGLLEPDDVVIVAASGTSGAGKSAKPHLLGSEVMGGDEPLRRRRRPPPHPGNRAGARPRPPANR